MPVLGVEIISNFFVSYLLNSLQAAWITLIIIKKKTIFILINKAQKGTNNPVLVDTTSHYYLA